MLICERGQPKEYHDDATGEEFLSVSQPLKVLAPDSFSYVSPDVLEHARLRGEGLHFLFHFLVGSRKGLCASPERPEGELGPYFDAMAQWVELTDPEPVFVERRAACRKYGFAGQPDQLSRLNRGKQRILTIVDLKSGVVLPGHRAQLEAYHRLEGYEEAREKVVLYLRKNGTFHEDRFASSPQDWAGFLNAVQVLAWRAAG